MQKPNSLTKTLETSCGLQFGDHLLFTTFLSSISSPHEFSARNFIQSLSNSTKTNIYHYMYNSSYIYSYVSSKTNIRIYESSNGKFYFIENPYYLSFCCSTISLTKLNKILFAYTDIPMFNLSSQENIIKRLLDSFTNQEEKLLWKQFTSAFPLYFERLGYSDYTRIPLLIKLDIMQDLIISQKRISEAFAHDKTCYSEFIADILGELRPYHNASFG